MAKKAKKEEEVPAKLTRSAKASSVEDAVLDSGAEDIEEDYLQKYQYMREIPLGDPRSNPRGGKAEIMKKSLLSQRRVTVMIPVDSGSDPSVPFSVQLNSYRLDLPRNQYIDVPEQVAEVIRDSHNQTVQALSRDRVDGNKDKESALG